MKTYFNIQYRRIYRFIEEFGIHPYIAFFMIPMSFVVGSSLLFYKTANAAVILLAFQFWLTWSFSDKQKNMYLQSLFHKKKYYILRLMENLFLAVPFLLTLLYFGRLEHLLIALIIPVILILYTSANSLTITIPTPFYKYPFEYVVGTRTYLIFIMAVYIIFFISLNVSNYNLSAFCLILLALICMGFYSKLENPYYIWIFNCNAPGFLQMKIQTAVKYGALTSLPILISLLIFYPGKIVITLLVFLIAILDIVLAVVAKYVKYPLSVGLGDAFLIALSVILPFLLLFSVPYFYLKSNTHLQPYLHDSIVQSK